MINAFRFLRDVIIRLRGMRLRARLRSRDVATGRLLIDAMQASPHRDIEIEPERMRAPISDAVSF
jgi:hypothetical protein